MVYYKDTMLKIRLQRIGRRNNPSYRVVVVDAATAVKKGKPVELLGVHDTVRKVTKLNDDRIRYWLSHGAQVSDTMHNILIKNGVLEGVKINVLPKKSPTTKKKAQEDGADTSQPEASADTAAPASEEAQPETAKDAEGTEETKSENKEETAAEVKQETAEKESPAENTPPESATEQETAAEQKADGAATEEKQQPSAPDTAEEKPQQPTPPNTPSAEG